VEYFQGCMLQHHQQLQQAHNHKHIPRIPIPAPSSFPSCHSKFVDLCQPHTHTNTYTRIIGANAINIDIPSFPGAFSAEVLKPFYVFQFLCCVLWIIDG